MEHETNRRSFLGFLTVGLTAIFSVILGVPIVSYVIDPRHRKAAKSNFKLVDGAKLDELAMNKPQQGVIRDTRHDGWTLYPSDVVGRVWVVLVGARPAGLNNMDDAAVETFNKNDTAKKAYLHVFTTICPHLGCSVNLDAAGIAFLCPCHGAAFTPAGTRVAPANNPAARDMDTLEWEIDPADPERTRIRVKYESYRATLAEKKLV